MKKLAVTTLLAAVILASAHPAPAQEETVTNLSGTWVFNEQKSDDIAQVMRQARGDRPGGGQHSGGRGGGGGKRGGRGGGQHPGNRAPDQAPDQEEFQKRALQAKREYEHLEIFHEGQEFDLTNGLDITQTYFTDGRAMSVWTQQGEMSASATWQGPVLVMEWRPSDKAPGRTRKFQLSEDGNTLTVTEERRLPGQDKPVKLRLVYDRRK